MLGGLLIGWPVRPDARKTAAAPESESRHPLTRRDSPHRTAPRLLSIVPPYVIAPIHSRAHSGQEEREPMYTVLIVILVLLLIGALPTWGYSSGWGYGPSGGLGLILLILIVLLVSGRL
jgi:hypothetical protein